MLHAPIKKIINSLKKILIFLIYLYRYSLGLILGGQCRFYPSCSHYMEDAILNYGIFKGVYLGLKRILKCNPFHPGGYDPIKKNEINYHRNK